MKFMCLHGAIGNSANFRVQLDAFCKNLEQDNAASFYFAQGTTPAPEPPGFNGYFGPGPHFRYLNDNGLALQAVMARIREFPDRATPEQALRALVPEGAIRGGAGHLVRPVLDALFEEMDREGGVEGIIGYSEGALVAASLLIEDQRRVVEEGLPRRLKAGIFFAGWPPLNPRTGDVVLADEAESHDLRICVPTLHVIGSEDPYLDGSKALYNICDQDTAIIFDHAKGHTLPQGARIINELGATTRETIQVACAC